MFKIHKNVRRLTAIEKKQYQDLGYVKNLPVFSNEAATELHNFYEDLSKRMPKDININKTNMWHKASKKFHDLCRTPAILDYVEDILGPNFVQWGGQFFNKDPKMFPLSHGIKTPNIGL